MKFRGITRLYANILLFSFIALSGCSPAGFVSPEGMVGTGIGAAAGSGVGWLFAESVGNTAENVLINGAIGAGVGMLAGAMLYQRNLKVAREREVVMREARMLDVNQQEIDQLRRKVDDASSWGANETRPWDERYQKVQDNRPYQGPKTLFP